MCSFFAEVGCHRNKPKNRHIERVENEEIVGIVVKVLGEGRRLGVTEGTTATERAVADGGMRAIGVSQANKSCRRDRENAY